jgi:hypothetical protein
VPRALLAPKLLAFQQRFQPLIPHTPRPYEKMRTRDAAKLGHFHRAAAHDPRDAESGKKSATGHCFTLNLRTQALSHLTVANQAERKHEQDLRALKR